MAHRNAALVNERERALLLLQRVEREAAFAAPLLQKDAERNGDSGFVRVLVLGVLRWRSLLDHFIVPLASRRLDKVDPAVVDILRLGLFQLFDTGVAPYAVVSETVDLAGRHAGRARGFVNAILRKASSSDLRALIPRGTSVRDVAVRNGHPEWLVARWTRTFGAARAEAIARANQELSYPDLLLNTARSADDLRAQLEGIETSPSPFLDDMVRLRGASSALAQALDEGWF